ncbi:sensor histidine kinase [Cohnella silvisoli]|uniref:histidine kinase n=1 Tax=Cohnella silvisoli TaxID=2873699 RepID=A0ABV1KZV3_9BACL|nr:histidine kinase [Cohnella silvisoli]MCD9025033.1 histidine kinase [Cohnella silvisoli]
MNLIKDFILQLAFIATLIFTLQIFFAERSERNGQMRIILSVIFGLSILLCMTFPVYVSSNVHMDIRIVPLLLGTLYGGLRTGILLCALTILYRFYIGVDLGFYTTILTLLFSMPAVVPFQKVFVKAQKKKRIQIALILSIYYCFVGLIVVSSFRGFSLNALQVHFIHLIITVMAVLFFTSLNETIKGMLQKNQQLQSEAKDAEIAFLRSQIKPHFLYNTLNSIAELCIDKPNKAEELTLNLSQYLRSSFDFKQLESLTTIENELELVKAYINIEKARFGARLNVEYDVDANLDIRIPPLILQPLVENAIRHGLMSNLRGGTVKISVKKEKGAGVSFAVEDNGCGMNDKKRDEILNPDVANRGIGLWNISQRIQLLYGRNIRIESAEGMGTKVFFDLPARPIEQVGG